jgi:hypothetical protein
MLDRLVGRAVLAERDRVVGVDPHGGQAGQRRQPDRAAHVVGELQERRAVGVHDAAVGRHPVDGSAHAVLAHAEEDVAPGALTRVALVVPAGELRLGRLREVGGAADHRRHVGGEGRHRLLPGCARGELVLAPVDGAQRVADARQRAPGPGGVPLGGAVGILLAPGAEALVPLRLQRGAAGRLVEVLAHLVGDEELGVGIPPEPLLGDAHVLLAQRLAVDVGRSHVGRGVADDRLHPDERRALVLLHGVVDGALERGQVVGVVHRLHVPAVGLEALGHVLGGEAQVGRAVERDVVVVVEVDDPPETEMTGQRGGLGGDALHEVTVGDDREDVVVLDLAPEVVTQEVLGHGHADAVGEALAQRAGGDLDAGGDVHAVALGVARGQRAPLPEALEL